MVAMVALACECNVENGHAEDRCNVEITSLPDELLSVIIVQLADDDYHMLTLPLVSSAFRRACTTGAGGATRFASRLRQVSRCVVDPNVDITNSEWGLAHVWGALQAINRYFPPPEGEGQAAEMSHHALLTSRLADLATAPGGVASLRRLISYCAAVAPVDAPSPPLSAEALFLEAEARRMQPASRAQALSRRATAGDRAASDAAASLNLQGEARAGAILRKEMAAQAQRQVDATCRRNWKLLPPAKRQEWERWAEQTAGRAERWHKVVVMTANLGVEQSRRLEPLW